MATIEDLQAEMAKGLRDKCIGIIRNDFRRLTREDAEDCVQLALATVAKHIKKVNDIESFVINKAKLRAIDLRNLTIYNYERQQNINRMYTPRRRDPMRPVDFRIDLERAIKQSVRGHLERKAAWFVIYEGYQAIEVAQTYPKERSIQAWEHIINRDVLPKVRRRMRRGGYRI
jgi:DNA-directed RNA polymerase specialized sigma24 family protein